MEARQPFSRLGWALFAQMAVMLAAQWGVLLLARAARPGLCLLYTSPSPRD